MASSESPPVDKPADPDRQLTMDEIMGHETVREYLRRSVREDDLPRSILFTGPRGVGKKTLAWALAKEIVSRDAAPASEGRAEHPGAGKIRRATHPDMLALDGGGSASRQIRVDDVRDMEDWAARAPLETSHRIVLIAPAEMMNTSAANALLKTLEEPPAHLILMLAADDAAALLPTIRSRCTTLPLEAIPAAELVPWLVRKRGLPEEKARLVVRLAEGRPGTALELAHGPMLEARGMILSQLVELRRHGFLVVFSVADRILSAGGDPATALRITVTLLRDALTTALGARDPINSDLHADLQRLCEDTEPERLLNAAMHVESAMARTGTLYGNQAPRHFMEIVFIHVGRILRQG